MFSLSTLLHILFSSLPFSVQGVEGEVGAREVIRQTEMRALTNLLPEGPVSVGLTGGPAMDLEQQWHKEEIYISGQGTEKSSFVLLT